MSTVRRIAVLGALVGAALCPSASLAADEAQPVALSATPTAVTLDANGNGKVVLTNSTALTLSIAARVVDDDGQPVAGAQPPVAGTLEPGAAAPEPVSVPAATKAATLVLIAGAQAGLPNGAVLRVALARAKATKPSVTKWTLLVVHAGFDHGRMLPMTQPCAGLALTKPTEVGTVQADGHQLSVTATCPKDNPDDVRLSVTHEGSHGREYAGTITIGDNEVELTVKDTLTWALMVLPLGLGIAAALAASWWQATGRAGDEALLKAAHVAQLVADSNDKNADRSFSAAAEKLGLPTNVRDWKIAAAVRARVDALREPLKRSPNQDEIDAANKGLDALALEAATWRETANLLGKLQLQIGNLAELHTYSGAIAERTLQRSGPLDLDAMADVKAAATEAVDFASGWPSAELNKGRDLALKLAVGDEARTTMESALGRLNAAANIADAKAALDTDFRPAYTAVRVASGRTQPRAELMAAAGGPGGTAFFESVETDDPAAEAETIARRIRAVDLAVLAVLLTAAFIAGMQALWVDKSFGGLWDILAALAWGLGAGAISAPLSTAISDFARSLATSAKAG